MLNFRSSEPGNSYRLGSYKKSPDLVDDNQKQTKYKKIKVGKCEWSYDWYGQSRETLLLS